MIKAEFVSCNGALTGFSVSGHAMFAEFGSDIVCASVSSALQLTANGITEIANKPADIKVEENLISLKVLQQGEVVEAFLKAFKLQLEILLEDYPNKIEIITTEV